MTAGANVNITVSARNATGESQTTAPITAAGPRFAGGSALRFQPPGPGCRRNGDKKTRDLHRAFLGQPNRTISAGGEVAAVKPDQLHRAEQCAEHEQSIISRFRHCRHIQLDVI